MLMQHIEDEVLDCYVMQTLSPPEVEEIEGHLLICEECQERLDGTSDFVQSISAAALELRQIQSASTLLVRTRSAGASYEGQPGLE